MAHAPQHLNNPCSLNENEQTPGKVWELLRHNNRFKKAVTRLEQLDKRSCLVGDGSQRRLREIGLAMVRRLGEIHSFAGIAIQWLVPEPLFEIHHVAIPANLDLNGKALATLKTVKLQEGITSDPADEKHWRKFEAHGEQDAQSVANCNGRLWRRGPHIHFQTSDDPRFCSKVDPLKEWREYFTDGRKFTLDTPWRDAPQQFKREFCFLWRYLDSRTTNPITGTRIDAPREHESNFFQGWSLLSAIGRNTIGQEALARAFTFDDSAQHYRVFAFPNSIRTRSEARSMAEWLFDQLAESLPARAPELYGSPLQWDILLSVQDLIRAGASFDEALQESFEKIHLKADDWHEGQPMPDQKKGWAQRGTDWQNTYRMMDAPLAGTGFVQTIFPGKPSTPPPTASVSGS
jgi:hypothetical protein